MDIQMLKEIGLTEGESKVYNALLDLGSSTVSPIAKEASVSMSKIYVLLEGLIKRGFVSYTLKNRIKIFHSSDPEIVVRLLKEKENKLHKYSERLAVEIPKIQSTKGIKTPTSEIFEGFRGIKSFYTMSLKEMSKGDTYRVMGIPKQIAEDYETFFVDFNTKPVKKKINTKLLFEGGSIEVAKRRAKLHPNGVRLLPPNVQTPAWVGIFGETIFIAHMQKHPILFVIRDKDIANSYKNYFDILWKGSTKVKA